MHILRILYLTALGVLSEGNIYQCGDDILIGRNQKRTLRFWSSQENFLSVQMIPSHSQPSEIESIPHLAGDPYSGTRLDEVEKDPAIYQSEKSEVITSDSDVSVKSSEHLNNYSSQDSDSNTSNDGEDKLEEVVPLEPLLMSEATTTMPDELVSIAGDDILLHGTSWLATDPPSLWEIVGLDSGTPSYEDSTQKEDGEERSTETLSKLPDEETSLTTEQNKIERIETGQDTILSSKDETGEDDDSNTEQSVMEEFTEENKRPAEDVTKKMEDEYDPVHTVADIGLTDTTGYPESIHKVQDHADIDEGFEDFTNTGGLQDHDDIGDGHQDQLVIGSELKVQGDIGDGLQDHGDIGDELIDHSAIDVGLHDHSNDGDAFQDHDDITDGIKDHGSISDVIQDYTTIGVNLHENVDINEGLQGHANLDNELQGHGDYDNGLQDYAHLDNELASSYLKDATTGKLVTYTAKYSEESSDHTEVDGVIKDENNIVQLEGRVEPTTFPSLEVVLDDITELTEANAMESKNMGKVPPTTESPITNNDVTQITLEYEESHEEKVSDDVTDDHTTNDIIVKSLDSSVTQDQSAIMEDDLFGITTESEDDLGTLSADNLEHEATTTLNDLFDVTSPLNGESINEINLASDSLHSDSENLDISGVTDFTSDVKHHDGNTKLSEDGTDINENEDMEDLVSGLTATESKPSLNTHNILLISQNIPSAQHNKYFILLDPSIISRPEKQSDSDKPVLLDNKDMEMLQQAEIIADVRETTVRDLYVADKNEEDTQNSDNLAESSTEKSNHIYVDIMADASETTVSNTYETDDDMIQEISFDDEVDTATTSASYLSDANTDATIVSSESLSNDMEDKIDSVSGELPSNILESVHKDSLLDATTEFDTTESGSVINDVEAFDTELHTDEIKTETSILDHPQPDSEQTEYQTEEKLPNYTAPALSEDHTGLIQEKYTELQDGQAVEHDESVQENIPASGLLNHEPIDFSDKDNNKLFTWQFVDDPVKDLPYPEVLKGEEESHHFIPFVLLKNKNAVEVQGENKNEAQYPVIHVNLDEVTEMPLTDDTSELPTQGDEEYVPIKVSHSSEVVDMTDLENKKKANEEAVENQAEKHDEIIPVGSVFPTEQGSKFEEITENIFEEGYTETEDTTGVSTDSESSQLQGDITEKYYTNAEVGSVYSDDNPESENPVSIVNPINWDGIPARKDDDAYDNEELPFFIKLPGSPNMVPVFIQYEPLKINYIPVENLSDIIYESPIDEVVNPDKENKFDVSKQSPLYRLIEDYEDDYSSIVNYVDQREKEQFQANKAIISRPDPFFIMEPPKLGTSHNNYAETAEIALKGTDNVEVPVEAHVSSKITYDHNSYPQTLPQQDSYGVNLESLSNPVFTLLSRVPNLPEDYLNPAYTPFPLTTNPPKTTSSEIPARTTDLVVDYVNQITHSETQPKSKTTASPATETPPYAASPQYSAWHNRAALSGSETTDKATSDGQERVSTDTPESNVLYPFPVDRIGHTSLDYEYPSFQDSSEVITTKVGDEITSASQNEDAPVPGRVYTSFHSREDIPGQDPTLLGQPQVNTLEYLPDWHWSKHTTIEVAEKDSASKKSRSQETESHSEVIPEKRGKELAHLGRTAKRSEVRQGRSFKEKSVYCEWNIKTEPGLYLLMTFHNLSAPYTVDCHGAYIEVEKERNGYDARWCGNRLSTAVTRPHVIFAKTELRITVYDDAGGREAHPTGFEADVEVIDLFDTKDYTEFMKSTSYPQIRRLLEG